MLVSDGGFDPSSKATRPEAVAPFDVTMAGLSNLQDAGADWHAVTTVYSANQHRGGEVYRFLRDDAGAWYMRFTPLIEPSVTPDGYGRFLVDVFHEWVRRDVDEVRVEMFYLTLAS